MKKMIYVEPNNFEATQFEFDNFHYELAERVMELLLMDCEDDENLTPMMTEETGKQLIFGLIKREPGQKGEKYKITIEKINSDEN